MADGQAQVRDGARAVLLHQDILGLEVTVGDAWLPWGGREREGGTETGGERGDSVRQREKAQNVTVTTELHEHDW